MTEFVLGDETILDGLRCAVTDASVYLDALGTDEDALLTYAALKDAHATLGNALRDASERVGPDLGSQPVVGKGAYIERKWRAPTREWNRRDLLSAAISRSLDERRVDPTTGEYEAAWMAVHRVVEECFRVEPRLEPLRARGIDIDEYSATKRNGGWTIGVRKL
jgi:hypothetical protein